MKKTFTNEQVLEIILRAGIEYELAGFENEVMDGELTQEEFDNLINQETLMSKVEEHLNDARTYRRVLTSPNTERQLEIKHINFLGTETIEKRKQNAVSWAIKKYS